MKLKDITNLRTGLVTARKKASMLDKHSIEYDSITMKSFNSNGTLNIADEKDKFKSKERIELTYLTQNNDILVRLREPNIAVHIDQNQTGMLIPSLVTIIRVIRDEVNSKFLTSYLNSKIVRRALESSLKGTTISMIKTKDLEDLEIKLPTLEEQTKIVAFLDLANHEIGLLEELKEKKEKYYEEIFTNILNGEYK